MDEFNNEAVVSEDIDIYAGWDDDPAPADDAEDISEETTEAETEETDQSESEEAEDASDDEGTEELANELDEAGKKSDQTFTLKHLDEVKEVDRDEVITLAQKGLDYDRIRAERDSLKSEKSTLKAHEDFLNELAELAGTSVEDLMVDTKARLVQQEEKKKGYDITFEQAKYRVQSDMKAAKKAAPPEEEVKEETPQPSLQEVREGKFKRFIESYPDVKSEDIPKEVWREFGDGSGRELTEIYARYENKKLREQIADLEKKNRRSTGSRKSNGSPIKEDDLYAGWG